MKRPRPDPAAIESAREAAREARVKAGLPAEAPGDAEYEQLRAELRAAGKKAARMSREQLLQLLVDARMVARAAVHDADAQPLVDAGLAFWTMVSTINTDPRVLMLTPAGHVEARKQLGKKP